MRRFTVPNTNFQIMGFPWLPVDKMQYYLLTGFSQRMNRFEGKIVRLTLNSLHCIAQLNVQASFDNTLLISE